MTGRLITLTAALLGSVATLAAASPTAAPMANEAAPQAQTQKPDQDKPAPFRVSVDVVAVDVQVIDRSGQPVPELGPEKFNVTINGRRRRVVSAERIASDAGGGTAPATAAAASMRGRVIVLAVDCNSFDSTATRGVIQATKDFVRKLTPDDFLGLSAYPNGAKVDPTRDHAAVLKALDTVSGQRDLAEVSQFNVRPSEMIDVTRELYSRGGGPRLDAIAARECGDPPDPFCRQRLITDVNGTALYYEGQGAASLGMLRSLIGEMSTFTGRKTLLLISGGMIASDTPGGRPDLSDFGIRIGKEAALANTAIYTLFVDGSFMERFSAQTRKGDKSLDNWNRDSELMARWLDQFTGTAGGALFNVQVGNAESALARIHSELSSYYLLGVEPGDEDRDGRTHEISVKTTHPNVTIRGRRWVMVPARGGVPAGARGKPSTPASPAAPPPSAAPEGPEVPVVPPRRVLPADVQALADAYDRAAYDSVQSSLARSTNLASMITAFRQSDSPWPNDPKRTAVFALELAFAGLRSEVAAAREEGGRLLGEYHARIRQPSGTDPFECWWFVTESAGLEGLFLPESAILFIPRALQRCPSSARLHLAYAFVSEQQWLRGGLTAAQEQDVVRRYEAAMKFPETEPEARVRAARYLFALGQHERALTMLNGGSTARADQEVRYFAELTRGQILRALGRSDEALAAFRAALAAWPNAQSARVSLMTLLLSRGDREGAGALAEAAQTASDDEFDPWWTYWLGDFRAYPAILDRLRALSR
jgi:VWFA-related protein